ncbi:hypothetical protein BJ741DRAFT_626755 [Chytriomyces cf. hyalinus JEL632]|nr:hypothetical protein BJ741DRAFT_626755 [Chytriomyces cf. hyalinus JEL632]
MVSIKSAVRDLPNLPRGKPVTVKDVAESATVAFHAFCVTARTLVQKSAISDFSINLNEFPVIPCLAMLVGYVLASLHMSFIVWPIFFVVFGAACVHVSSVSRLRTTADSTGELAEAKSQT